MVFNLPEISVKSERGVARASDVAAVRQAAISSAEIRVRIAMLRER
jgi:hypothetical protein